MLQSTGKSSASTRRSCQEAAVRYLQREPLANIDGIVKPSIAPTLSVHASSTAGCSPLTHPCSEMSQAADLSSASARQSCLGAAVSHVQCSSPAPTDGTHVRPLTRLRTKTSCGQLNPVGAPTFGFLREPSFVEDSKPLGGRRNNHAILRYAPLSTESHLAHRCNHFVHALWH